VKSATEFILVFTEVLVNNLSQISRRNKSIIGANFHMVSKPSSGKMEAKKKGMENNRDQNISELASKLEEGFACLSSSASAENSYIDSRASAHMTGEREYLSSYQEEHIYFEITMGNRMKCTLVGKGTVIFQTTTGNSLQATNVLHVSGMGMNFISVS